MKKLFALLLTVILAFTCFTTFASAATDSPKEEKGIVSEVTAKSNSNTAVTIKITAVPSSVDTTKFDSSLAQNNASDNTTMKIVDKRAIIAVGGTPDFPVSVSFKINGVNSSSKGYFLVYKDDGTVEKVSATMGDGVMTGSFSNLGSVAFVVDENTATAINAVAAPSASTTESPKTSSDTATPIAMVLVCLSVVAAGFAVKKIKA